MEWTGGQAGAGTIASRRACRRLSMARGCAAGGTFALPATPLSAEALQCPASRAAHLVAQHESQRVLPPLHRLDQPGVDEDDAARQAARVHVRPLDGLHCGGGAGGGVVLGPATSEMA